MKSIERLTADAKRGYAEAQTRLGFAYAFGDDGAPQDDAASMMWFLAAAKQGVSEAQYIVGDLYAYGIGVPPDEQQAIDWYLMADLKYIANGQNTSKVPDCLQTVQSDSPALTAIVGDEPMARIRLHQRLWGYIRENKLLDEKNPRLITADRVLKEVFLGKEQLSVFLLGRLVAGQVTEVTEPATVDKASQQYINPIQVRLPAKHAESSVSIGDPLRTRAPVAKQGGLESTLEEIDSLIGLGPVKAEVASLVNLIRIRQLRTSRGIKCPPMSMHMVFTGNPGTGKTTVARLLARVFRELGLIARGHLTEVDRSGLVAGYVGQTAIKVTEVCRKALGGILFIDEAYSLAGGSEQDYGREAIETLLKFMEDHRDEIIVIVAGYRDKMHSFLRMNPGLQSRFNKFIDFPDYSAVELVSIFAALAHANSYRFDAPFARRLETCVASAITVPDGVFANGRMVRNLFESVVANHSNRLAMLANPTDDDLQTFDVQDLDEPVHEKGGLRQRADAAYGGMVLEICGERTIADPTGQQIRTELEGLSSPDHDSFVILHESEMAYVQAKGDKTVGFHLEYQEGSIEAHFQATDDHITLEKVVEAFISYRDGNADWKAAFTFEKVTL